jgi:DNA-binding CsgD family transcriptional regulator
VIAALYDGAFRVPIDDFQNFALELMRGVIPFDSASWAVANNDINAVHSMVLINQSHEVLADYLLNWQADDFLRHHAIANPGFSFRNEDLKPVVEWLSLPIYQQFCHRVGVEHTLGISILDTNTRLSNMIYFWRADIDRPFSDEELAIQQACAPHMAAAWRHRQVVGLYIHAKGGRDPLQFPLRGHAVVDNLGIIHTSDMPFGETLHAAFPGWSGTALPAALTGLIASGHTGASIAGLDFALTRSDQRHILSVNGASAPSPLSVAEMRTALLFAAGSSYKDIAKQLSLSTHTVRNQISSAYRKLAVHSKMGLAEAIKYQG